MTEYYSNIQRLNAYMYGSSKNTQRRVMAAAVCASDIGQFADDLLQNIQGVDRKDHFLKRFANQQIKKYKLGLYKN